MHINRVQIENFRNFAKLDVKLGQDAVIVGANKVGKSNLLYALRLLLDPSLPDSARQLRTEDFWDGMERPLRTDAFIRIVVELAGFDKSDEQLALLADCLVKADPMIARLTYEFRRPLATTGDAGREFEFSIFGGDRGDAPVSWTLRRRLAMEVVQALRDSEGDLASWRRSPLRPLLEKAVDAIDPKKKQSIATGVEAAASAILQLPEIDALGKLVSDSLETLVGAAQTADVQLGLAPTDAERLLQSLRLLLDGGVRGVGEASLGVANTLYLTLKLLEIRQLSADGLRDHTFLAIEEPEAHLHPHVQRNVFRSLLRSRAQAGAEPKKQVLADGSATRILTTHSPYIASVAPIRTLVLLRSTGDRSIGVSASDIQFADSEEADLERYLDVTRAEMLFARGVILVEGIAETLLVPRIATFLGHDLDALGITVCSVAGANFTPHAKLLHKLGIPFVVITDFDPNEEKGSLGEKRAVNLVFWLVENPFVEDAELLKQAAAHGIFLGASTLEIDLLRSGRAASMSAALQELGVSKAARDRAAAWLAAAKIPPADEERFLGDIEAIGKGRFAQQLAKSIKRREADPQGPKYITDAIAHIVSRCAA